MSPSVQSLSIVLALVLAWTIQLMGQEVLPLNLNQATNLAIANHPEIKKISWQKEKVIADGYQQSRLVNPQLGPLANEIGNEGQGGQFGFFLQKNIVRNDRVDQIQSAAQWEARSFLSQSELIQRKIAFQTAKLFVEFEFLNKKRELIEKRRVELTNIKKIAQNLMKGGEIAPLDLMRLEIEISQVAQTAQQTEIEIMKNVESLHIHLGSSEPIELDFDFDQELKLILQSSEERQVDLDKHPQVRQVSDQMEAQKWRYQVANSRTNPDWQLQTSVNYDTSTDDFFGGFQLNIPWMINDRKTGLIDSAAASVQILNESRNSIKRRLKQKLVVVAAKRMSSIAKLKSIDATIIPKVDEVSKKTISLFHAGETDYKSVKDAVMMGFDLREQRLRLAMELLLLEVETETITLE